MGFFKNITYIKTQGVSISSGFYQQSFRFYLENFPEQEELRKEWFKKNHYFLHKNRFGQTSLIISAEDIISALIKVAKIGYKIEEENDNYFANRWLRRQ